MNRSLPSRVSLLAATGLILSGCATPVSTVEPRTFVPVVEPPPQDMAVFERDFSVCAAQASEDAAVSWPVKEAEVISEFNPFALGGGAIVIGLIMSVGEEGAREHGQAVKRQAIEKHIQATMTACLKARGHTVTAWRLVNDGKASAGAFQTPTQPTGRALLLQEAEQQERIAASDPKARGQLKIVAERYDRLAEGAHDPQERARFLEKAAEARRKADEPSPSAVTLRMPSYSAGRGPSVLSEAPPRTFAVDVARDARPGANPGSLIGHPSGSGSSKHPDAEVDTIPPPAQLLQDVFSAELAAAGHRPSSDNPDVRIVPEMRRFELRELELSWRSSEVSAAVDVKVNLRAAHKPARSTVYTAECKVPFGFLGSAGEGDMKGVVADCLGQIGAQFRQDAAVRDFLKLSGPQR